MDFKEQLRYITRGTVDVISSEELLGKLAENRPLNIKFGVDPTAPDIHLGHTVPLRKLRTFQDLGHHIQLIIGDYTASVGDPSGRSKTRPMLTPEQIAANMKTYTEQVFKVLDQSRTNLVYNSSWLGKFSGLDLLKLGTKHTVNQLLQRRDFGKRIEEQQPISLTELLYPLLVGYDSVHLHSDVEIGGTDQLFNFMTSREIQKAYGQVPEVIVTLPLLEGLDGTRKMSKSYGNAIGVNDDPFDMYGKLMSIPDNTMWRYYDLLSDTSEEDIATLKLAVDAGENPMKYKQRLAREIVSRYHGDEYALGAENRFEQLHRRRDLPHELESKTIHYNSDNDLGIIYVLRQTGRASSNREARTLLEQGGVDIDGENIRNLDYRLNPDREHVLKVGKRHIWKIRFDKAH